MICENPSPTAGRGLGWGFGMSVERARKLRTNQTDAERVLWRKLRELKSEGFHFRHQAPMGEYIADFACHHARVVIEIDGGQRGATKQIERDTSRTEWLESRGYTVLRFWNNEVLQNLDGVMVSLRAALAELPPPHSPPRRGGGV